MPNGETGTIAEQVSRATAPPTAPPTCVVLPHVEVQRLQLGGEPSQLLL